MLAHCASEYSALLVVVPRTYGVRRDSGLWENSSAGSKLQWQQYPITAANYTFSSNSRISAVSIVALVYRICIKMNDK